MQISVFLTNGRIERFVQTDAEEASRIRLRTQPLKLFSDPYMVIAGSYSVTGFRTGSVEMVEFIMDGIDNWVASPSSMHVHEITQEAFLSSIKEPDESMKRELDRTPGESITGFAEIDLASGLQVHAELHAKVGLPIEQMGVITRVFSAPSICVYGIKGGVLVLNPQNVIRVEMFPGPANAPATAIKARHLIAELREEAKRKGETSS